MKKFILLVFIPLFGIAVGCSGKTNQQATETIEKSTQTLDQVIQSSAEQVDSVQTEIDTLLEGI